MSITDLGVQSAATALLEDLQSTGCTNGYDQYVADFQNAWNQANAGQPLVLRDGTPGADGFYGANTQAALQATLNASGTVEQAPTGCVAATPGSANQTQGGGAAVVPVGPTPPAPAPPAPPKNTTTTTPASSHWIVWVVAAAAVAGTGAAYVVHKKRKRARR